MTSYVCEPGAEIGGVYANGETWHVKFSDKGALESKDEGIAAVLEALADDPDNPVKRAKGKVDA